MKKKSKKKKSKKEEPEEESELEKEVKETEKEIEEEPQFEENARMRFLSGEVKAPVLEKVNISEAPLNLERGIISEGAPAKNQKKEEQPFNYLTKGNTEEPKYQTTYEHVTSEFHPSSEIEEFGKRDLFPKKEVSLRSSPEAASTETNFEKYETPERIDRENLGKNIFEKREVKYKPSHS